MMQTASHAVGFAFVFLNKDLFSLRRSLFTNSPACNVEYATHNAGVQYVDALVIAQYT